MIRKKLCNLVLLGCCLLVPVSAWAHFGGLDKDGGHRCWKNCAEYGLEYGQYHKHKPGTYEAILPGTTAEGAASLTLEPEPEPEPALNPVPDNTATSKNTAQDPDHHFFTWSKFFWTGLVSLFLILLLELFCFTKRCVDRGIEHILSRLRRLVKNDPGKKKGE